MASLEDRAAIKALTSANADLRQIQQQVSGRNWLNKTTGGSGRHASLRRTFLLTRSSPFVDERGLRAIPSTRRGSPLRGRRDGTKDTPADRSVAPFGPSRRPA
jgi:hypothetical protein